MSCIHYKFRSALEYDTITFDGLSISLADLKRSIITQKKFGKNTDFDLEVTNAQTKEGELFCLNLKSFNFLLTDLTYKEFIFSNVLHELIILSWHSVLICILCPFENKIFFENYKFMYVFGLHLCFNL